MGVEAVEQQAWLVQAEIPLSLICDAYLSVSNSPLSKDGNPLIVNHDNSL